nr:MAG TPA: hypothetical protein [Caudoviricetes sp.]
MYCDYFEAFEFYIEKDDDKFYIYIPVNKRYKTIAKNYEWYITIKDELYLCIESKNNSLNSVVYEAKDVIYNLMLQDWRLRFEN